MLKKKKAQFTVSIPYELREDKLWMQPISWPNQCPCCNEKESSVIGTHKYEHSARYSQTTSGTQTTTNSYPLEWSVPYCLKCQEHVKAAENWRQGIIIFCLIVPLIIVLAIDASSTMLFLIMYAIFTIGGLIFYNIILNSVVIPKQKKSCLDHNLAFWASSPPTDIHEIIFNFHNKEYAQTFSSLNKVILNNNSE